MSLSGCRLTDWIPPLLKAIETASLAGLREVANNANTEARDLVPVDIGNLRQAMYVETRGKSVFAVTGEGAPGLSPDADVGAYVEYQYDGALRHRGNVNDKLLPLRALHPDALTGNRVHERKLRGGGSTSVTTTFGRRNTGGGDRALYNRAYKLAILAGEIVKQDSPEWYNRIEQRPEFVRQSEDILVRFFA